MKEQWAFEDTGRIVCALLQSQHDPLFIRLSVAIKRPLCSVHSDSARR